MSKFASRRNTLSEQRVIGRELEALLDAVEVTGLSAWERALLVYGTGLAEGTARRASAVVEVPLSVPSANPVQTPLFEEAA